MAGLKKALQLHDRFVARERGREPRLMHATSAHVTDRSQEGTAFAHIVRMVDLFDCNIMSKCRTKRLEGNLHEIAWLTKDDVNRH